MIVGWPASGEIDDALGHRDVQLQRRVGVDDRVGVGPLSELLRAQPVRDLQQREVVGDLLAAAGEDERYLVGQQSAARA